MISLRSALSLATLSITLWLTLVALCIARLDAAAAIVGTGGFAQTVLGLGWWWRKRRRADRISSPGTATYISSHALLDLTPITIEIPRQYRRLEAAPELAMATTGGHRSPGRRSQDYWDAVADVAETLLERRRDDPDPDPA